MNIHKSTWHFQLPQLMSMDFCHRWCRNAKSPLQLQRAFCISAPAVTKIHTHKLRQLKMPCRFMDIHLKCTLKPPPLVAIGYQNNMTDSQQEHNKVLPTYPPRSKGKRIAILMVYIRGYSANHCCDEMGH